MGELRLVEPVVRFCAVISRHESARQWAKQRLAGRWGELAETGPPCPFEAGGFYEHEMGDGLVKELVAITAFADPGGLADWKTETNQWEAEFAEEFDGAESRPLNLDPGYVSQAKLVLATIKDRDHRIYLREGIFAEVTLNYVGKRWIHHRWSYPDYRSDAVANFAADCRARLREHLKATGGFRVGRK
ncbi:DUF4416 family protein [Rhodopirellula sp. JC740]|uniref:DUF4416 family protein n=1 Tax=Rhodopirellula halodulae TaxID=2894198 RepID=A0ABS8NKM6_9BACT|nr:MULTISPECIES: DUF4416 family protein [unclassified Rhodopirellula]MCC9644087.1 DUF4416 family protein [Rhodopirellula sp. JC740]MCC9657249.1 DUF4416 family protein [Rhodopirellula sp. JC737]